MMWLVGWGSSPFPLFEASGTSSGLGLVVGVVAAVVEAHEGLPRGAGRSWGPRLHRTLAERED